MGHAPSFWWHIPASWQARLLQPLGTFYGFIAGRRMQINGSKAALPVICIGNFVAGGAGKTPTAIAVCSIVTELGYRPVFLSRGYGGNIKEPLVVKATHRADQVGDEALLLCQHAPTIISADRVAGAALCGKYGDLIIMDDGFQNPSLRKNLCLVVVDKTVGVGNAKCLPAGPLRAPLSIQLAHTDVLIIIQNSERSPHPSLQRLRGDFSQFDARAQLKVIPEKIGPAIAYCAIGRPDKFFNAAQKAGYQLIEQFAFKDHHPLSTQQAQRLLQAADAHNAQLITTQKDKSRLKGSTSLVHQALDDASTALELCILFKDDDALKKIFQDHLAPVPEHL